MTTDLAQRDWFGKLFNEFTHLVGALVDAFAPPSEEPVWRWLEQHYELDSATTAFPGAISFDLFPASKIFFEHAQNWRVRRITVMVSAQSGKTENAIMLVLWRIVERPTPTMWTMAVADQCEEFAKDRLYPSIEHCKPVFEIVPKEREFWTKRMLKLPTMTLHLRGSNSQKKLQSSPIGCIICDERREWKKGSITKLRKRLMTFSDSQEISMGVAGNNRDELHTDYLEGSQGVMHFRCLHCQHSQPFRFSLKPTILFPAPRECGGLVWDTNDTTKPKGRWDYAEVKKTVRFQCENPKCRHLYRNTDKGDLLKTIHEVHKNPKALPSHVSMHWNTLMMPWVDCAWEEIVERFLKACAAFKHGDIEPMRTFITEDLGEPMEMPDAYKQKGDLMERQSDYNQGEPWMDKTKPFPQGSDSQHLFELEQDTTLILTFDRQLHGLWYVIRQWRTTGQSRLIKCGKVTALEEIRALQIQWRIRDACIWGDDGGPQVAIFRQQCMVWNWNIVKGEDKEYYNAVRLENGVEKSFRQGWQQSEFDPGVGTTNAGKATIKAFLWSNPWFKQRLYFLFVAGKGPLWEIARNMPTEYFEHLNGNEWRERENAKGEKEGYFHENGHVDLADCELMQLVVADIGGITRTLQAQGR